MCGIAGIVHCSQRPLNARLIQRMTDLVHYRGPDDEGFGFWGRIQGLEALPAGKASIRDAHLEGGVAVALGHRRLSILDLSPAGNQPMASADGRYWIVFNGEIYNYRELRTDLGTRGHRFVTGTDTEVILAAYAEWGDACLHRFNGMWAFVIFDEERRTLFGSRDRFGVKPFYYAVEPERFGFASEIKQLLVGGFGSGRAERSEVAQFLLYGSVNVAARTFFEGIHQLLPGEAFRWRLADGTVGLNIFRYYQPPYNRSIGPDGRLDEYRQEFRHLLEDAVRLRLRSDVPVGSCLSGGLDSSSIVIMANRLLRDAGPDVRQKTFTSCFLDPRFDEWGYAAQVAAATDVEANRVFPEMDNLWNELNALTWHQEEPFRSTSIYAQWNVMRVAKSRGITVLLDGQGADEVMAGYHFYIPMLLGNLLRAGRWVRAGRETRALAHSGVLGATFSPQRVAIGAARYVMRVPMRPSSVQSFVHREYRQPPEHLPGAHFQDHLYRELFGSLQSLLRYEDRNSMAFSIEARTPFLDYRLVELFLRMPGAYKLRDGWTKPFLREAMADVMPEPVRVRADKKGFVTPETIWYDAHTERIRATLLADDSPISQWIDQGRLRGWLDHRPRHARDFSLWRLLSVHAWMGCFGLS